ncbi:hypothetical protein HYV74_02865 [Candidatus Uhrbacteria bacterium]|nr:hypothetical protein [Candidatus Uhrbacteria bacterium]
MVHHPRHMAEGGVAVLIAVIIAGIWVWRNESLRPLPPLTRDAVVPSAPEPAPEAPPLFLSWKTTRAVATLQLDELPSVGSGLRRVIPYRDGFMVLTERASWMERSQVLWYADDSAPQRVHLIAQLNPRAVSGCEVHDIAIVRDVLYLGCLDVGVMEIDLIAPRILGSYGIRAGIPDLRNFHFAVDGDALWVGTYNGAARIDVQSRTVRAYRAELGIRGALLNVEMYARNGEVWALVRAHAESAGGVARYDASRDQWIAYGPDAFGVRDRSRIDFEEFIVSDHGVFAVYQDGGPDNVVLATTYERDGRWIPIAHGKYRDGSRARMLQEQLPPRATYVDAEEQRDPQGMPMAIRAFRGGAWVTITPDPAFHSYYAVLPGSATVPAFVISSIGIEAVAASDFYPRLVARTAHADILRSAAWDGRIALERSADRRYIAVAARDVQAMDGAVTGFWYAIFDHAHGGVLMERRVDVPMRDARARARVLEQWNPTERCPRDRSGVTVGAQGLEVVLPGSDAHDAFCFRGDLERKMVAPWI